MPTSLFAALIGIVLGVAAALIWRTVSARVRRVEFWPSVAALARALAAGGDEREFFRQYGQVLKLLVRFLGRQALVLGLSFLPVTLFVTLAVPRLMERDSRRALDLAVSPRQPVSVKIGNREQLVDHDRRITRTPAATISGTLARAGGEFAIGSRFQNFAVGGSPPRPVRVLPGLDMESAADALSLLLLPPLYSVDRLFRPGWVDPEWSFYLALCVASAATMIILPRRPE